MHTYHLDYTDGSDSDDGLSPKSAWKNVSKINSSSFEPGDFILFKRGETWTGIQLSPPSSGAPGLPITFGAYGFGAKPIIDGNDAVECINVDTKQYLVFENLELTQGNYYGLRLDDCSYIVVKDVDAHEAGNDNLICWDGTHSVEIYGGKFYNGYAKEGGYTATGIEISNNCHDILIDGAECYGQLNSGMGISIHSHAGEAMPYNVTIRNVYCHDNAAHGIQVWKQDTIIDSDLNIRILDSKFNDNIDDGIRIHKSSTVYPKGVLIDGCEVMNNTRYAMFAEGDDLVVRRSLFHDGRMVTIREFMNLKVHNCTFYLTGYSGYSPLMLQPYGASARTDGAEVRNCIFVAAASAAYVAFCDDTDNIDYDYNLYDRANDTDTRWRWSSSAYNYANWKTQSGGDANSLSVQLADFEDIANDDFRLQSISPCIDAGVDVGLPYCGVAPDIGYKERER